jgi:hypothetical protein
MGKDGFNRPMGIALPKYIENPDNEPRNQKEGIVEGKNHGVGY